MVEEMEENSENAYSAFDSAELLSTDKTKKC